MRQPHRRRNQPPDPVDVLFPKSGNLCPAPPLPLRHTPLHLSQLAVSPPAAKGLIRNRRESWLRLAYCRWFMYHVERECKAEFNSPEAFHMTGAQLIRRSVFVVPTVLLFVAAGCASLFESGNTVSRQEDAVSAHVAVISVAPWDNYRKDHTLLPPFLDLNRQRSFVETDPDPNSAADPAVGGFGNNPGHGTGTLGILAGNQFNGDPFEVPSGFVGGAPFATVVPVRVANSVVLFTNSSIGLCT
jgi:hypothetical protein